MAADTFMACMGVYDSVDAAKPEDAAKPDYQAVHDLQTKNGLVVVAVSGLGSDITSAMRKAENVEQKELTADVDEITKDAEEA